MSFDKLEEYRQHPSILYTLEQNSQEINRRMLKKLMLPVVSDYY